MEATLIEKIRIRRKKLDTAKKNLKAYFVGLDEIIDKLFNNLETWYVLPEVVSRPTIINMWGLTGTGKTDLIRRLAKELEFNDKFVEIQMDTNSVEAGERSWGCSTVKAVLSESSISEDDAGILLLDEMQRYRTVSQNGEEVNPKAFADVWMLLSDGKFGNAIGSKNSLLDLILHELYYEDHKDDKQNQSPTPTSFESPKETNKIPESPNHKFHLGVYQAKELKSCLKLREPISEIMTWGNAKKIAMIEEKLKDPNFSTGLSYRKLLIVISGNIDEAYSMSKMCSETDIEADTLHAFSKTITVLDIKDALLKRFKPEQIARFGNTHIIYPAFSKMNFQELIRRRCKTVLKDVQTESGISIFIDESVYDVIYKNGVYPAQGVRPLFTTISNILESSLPKFILPALEADNDKLFVRCVNDMLVCEIEGQEIKVKIERPIENIKEEQDINLRALASVHEAGHAIAYASLFKIVPLELKASVAGSENAGYMMRNKVSTNKSFYLKAIQVCLAGRAAEEVVFGNGFESKGCVGDLSTATTLACEYVRDLGFDGTLSVIGSPAFVPQANNYSTAIDSTNAVVEDLIREQKKAVSTLITNNVKFLKEVASVLMDKGEIKPDQFIVIASKFGYPLEMVKHGKHIYDSYEKQMKSFFSSVV